VVEVKRLFLLLEVDITLRERRRVGLCAGQWCGTHGSGKCAGRGPSGKWEVTHGCGTHGWWW